MAARGQLRRPGPEHGGRGHRAPEAPIAVAEPARPGPRHGPPVHWTGRPAAEQGAIAVTEVRAEITANVWQVHVQAGQTIAEGDTVAILESMKMEIPVESPTSGTVTDVKVAPNDQVQEGDLIAVIE